MEDKAPTTETGDLDNLIAPEVHHDEFSEVIRNLARSAEIETVLEIGSSSGEGSTLAWVEGLRENPRKPKLFCMEVSRVRCDALEKRWGPEGFVECFLGSSVDIAQFPPASDVARFHREVKGPLQKYPLEQVLGWRQTDIDYIAREGVPTGLIREIKKLRGIANFGAVLIDGSEFTGNAELDEVYGAEFILLDDTQTYKCHAAHQRLLHDPGYELIAENPNLRHGYSVFRRRRRTVLDPLPADAPVHYFTIVLNGEPFIRHHVSILSQLSFPWHWHVVEGAAMLTHDTGWSAAGGGTLPDDRHRDGLSVDGTSLYLDEIAKAFPRNITVHRKPAGRLWDGKIEMVAEPLKHIYQDAVLWEIDADELWTAAQLEEGRRMFLGSPEKAAAFFWCDFFVGQQLVVSTRNCYSQNPAHEWLRAWRFRPGMKWLTHEPPALAERMDDGSWRDVARGKVFTHPETEAAGLVFQHFAYATEAQVAFKERYYGYAGAVESWRKLQAARDFPVALRDYFSWVRDGALVDTAEKRGIAPLASCDPESGKWMFATNGASSRSKDAVVVDGIFFQFNNTGIGRVWLETLKQWAVSDFSKRVWLLDRDGTAPQIPGIRIRRVERYDPGQPGDDSLMLQRTCDELGAGVFISSYYTAPISTPAVAMVYDMIPELLGDERESWAWRAKELALLHARRIACISQSTAADVLRLHPGLSPASTVVTQIAASPAFRPADPGAIADFRERHTLTNDYVILAGERIGIHVGTQGYKNAALAFRAWSLLPAEEKRSLSILCAGGKPELEDELRVLAPDADVRIIRFSDEDLRLAYGGAVALLYPSLYEGFGLPVIEAMACECPVITCRRASLAEVAGDAALFVDPWDAKEAAEAIRSLRSDPAVRARFKAMGLEQAERFSFPKMASLLAAIVDEVAAAPPSPEFSVDTRIWKHLRDLQEANTKSRSELAAQSARLKEATKLVNQAEKSTAKANFRLAQEKEKRRRPFKRLWDRLRGRTHPKRGS